MNEFRRPLGVLIFGLIALVVGLVMAWSGAVTLSIIGGWLGFFGFLSALGAFAMIAWRLVRRPRL